MTLSRMQKWVLQDQPHHVAAETAVAANRTRPPGGNRKMSILKQKIIFPKLTSLNLTQNLSQFTVAQNPSLMPIILQLVLSRWARGEV